MKKSKKPKKDDMKGDKKESVQPELTKSKSGKTKPKEK